MAVAVFKFTVLLLYRNTNDMIRNIMRVYLENCLFFFQGLTFTKDSRSCIDMQAICDLYTSVHGVS